MWPILGWESDGELDFSVVARILQSEDQKNISGEK